MLDQKRILVTGACGTVGSELIRQLSETANGQSEIVALDNNESELFFLDQQFLDNPSINFFLADVRDRDKLSEKMKGVDIVFHAAALKHVTLCEQSPFEAVQTNIIGVQNVIHAANECNVEKVIFTSSDKAVNPTNVMGTSKLMGERIITAANSLSNIGNSPIFSSTRFGNVLGSSGSVIPVFHEQIRQGGPVTLTHPEMTRFVMSIQEAVSLVIESAELARGGEVFITKMPVVKIADLAEVMIEVLAPHYGFEANQIEIKEIGPKPGEKMYEELMNQEETRRALELRKYFAILPAFRNIYQNIKYDFKEVTAENVTKAYISTDEKPLDKNELLTFLADSKLIPVS